MKVFTGKKTGRVFFIRIDEGDDIIESVTSFIADHKVSDGIVSSAIGTLSSAVVHYITTTTYPSSFDFFRLNNRPIEVSSVNGLIVDGIAHLHAVVSDGERVFSGHLEPGCKSLYIFEMAVIEVEGIDVTRKPNQHNKKQLESKS